MCFVFFLVTSHTLQGTLYNFCTLLPALAGIMSCVHSSARVFIRCTLLPFGSVQLFFFLSDLLVVPSMSSINLYTCFKWLHSVIDGALSPSKLSNQRFGHMKISSDWSVFRRPSNGLSILSLVDHCLFSLAIFVRPLFLIFRICLDSRLRHHACFCSILLILQ